MSLNSRTTRTIPNTEPTGRDPLLREGWSHIAHTNLDHLRAGDWALLDSQREIYRAQTLASQVLRLLSVSERDATFGYQVNNYHHCLQTAALMYRDGLDEEDVVLGLLHDIGFTLCPDRHEEFAATLLGPYMSERNVWVLLKHPVFQAYHIHERPDVARDAREAYRGHPWFEDCARFVERYDIPTIDPGIEIPQLSFFEPMVQRFFQRPKDRR